jgi:hypothetical protein
MNCRCPFRRDSTITRGDKIRLNVSSKKINIVRKTKTKLIYQVALYLLQQNADGGEEHFLFADDHQLVNALSERQKQTKIKLKLQICVQHTSLPIKGKPLEQSTHKTLKMKILVKLQENS